MAKILLVDDDLSLCNVLVDWLQDEEKHTVDCAHTIVDGAHFIDSFSYDAIVLDWALPDGSGVELCRQKRNAGLLTPILILTGKGQISEKTQGLDSGADDYLTKPFDHRELSARLRALLRRAAKATANELTLGQLTLDISMHKASKSGEPLKLAPLDFALLEFLMRHPGKVFTPAELLDRVWRSEEGAGPESVRSAIKRLRQQLDDKDAATVIENVFGVGYRLRADV